MLPLLLRIQIMHVTPTDGRKTGPGPGARAGGMSAPCGHGLRPWLLEAVDAAAATPHLRRKGSMRGLFGQERIVKTLIQRLIAFWISYQAAIGKTVRTLHFNNYELLFVFPCYVARVHLDCPLFILVSFHY